MYGLSLEVAKANPVNSYSDSAEAAVVDTPVVLFSTLYVQSPWPPVTTAFIFPSLAPQSALDKVVFINLIENPSQLSVQHCPSKKIAGSSPVKYLVPIVVPSQSLLVVLKKEVSPSFLHT